jgi:hypothetical protein
VSDFGLRSRSDLGTSGKATLVLDLEDTAQGEEFQDLSGVRLTGPRQSRVFLPGEIDAFILSSSDPCNSLARLIL